MGNWQAFFQLLGLGIKNQIPNFWDWERQWQIFSPTFGIRNGNKTKRYGPLKGPTSSFCRGLHPLGKVFFLPFRPPRYKTLMMTIYIRKPKFLVDLHIKALHFNNRFLSLYSFKYIPYSVTLLSRVLNPFLMFAQTLIDAVMAHFTTFLMLSSNLVNF